MDSTRAVFCLRTAPMVVVSSLNGVPSEPRIITFAKPLSQTGFPESAMGWRYDHTMESLDSLLREAEVAHGHLCAGQVLGVGMAMLGCRLLGIDDPRGLTGQADRKRLVTFVEIDRCATDAIAVVTGCRLGKRALKFRDWGKMAATFVDLGIKDVSTGQAIR